ncbi:MAG: sugar transporter [[Clostridium] scindens]
MSISVEYANEHKDSPAVLCCRAEEGTVLSAHNLEDPAIFDDLEDSGLLSLEGALSIGQVLGARLTKTADSLTPVTLELVDQIQEQEEETEGKEKEEAYAQDLSEAAAQAAYPFGNPGANTPKLHIGEGRKLILNFH